jgi:hypothetical protein
MISHFLRGYSWEPSPVLDLYASDSGAANDLTGSSGGGRTGAVGGGAAAAAVALAPQPDAHRPAEQTYPRLVEDSPSADTGVRSAVAHLRRYQAALASRSLGGPPELTPPELYLVDSTPQAIREVIGFRLRGHPMALMGAFLFPRHQRSQDPDGRPSLTSFFSKPPRVIGYSVAPVPPGYTIVFLPYVSETIPRFIQRLREEGGSATELDASVIDIAFDLRFRNPSEIRQHAYRGARPTRSVFRTIAGHVVSGVSVGLSQTLHTDERFVTLSDAIQHRPDGDLPLPNISVNRSILALQSLLPAGQPEDAIRSTLAFHPATAASEHILGAPFEEA